MDDNVFRSIGHNPIQIWADQLRRRRSPTAPLVENSIPLRVAVQLLVSVGIASVTIAAVGVTRSSALNLLAIPLSAGGGFWSWRSRNRSNITFKFLIAFGMLAALGFFLVRLVGEGGDTRIRLAELLIHLQILHSFDMPRRKDLGYSIVIALILLGVAATVSQTLTLAPVLVIFLALALPVLILDYRSRLGLHGRQRRTMMGLPNIKRWVGLLVVITGLGLAIFALLPRFPGYQIRNFPLSDTINVQGEFSGNQILNSGYAAGGNLAEADETNGDGVTIQGLRPVDGPGEMDGETYYGFSQRINQNLRGTLTPKVVMRVRSQAEGFWRVLAFDRYTGQGWEISRSGAADVEILPRSPFSYQTDLPTAAFKGQQLGANRYRSVVQTYTIVSDLPNLIPVLHQAKQLYFPTQEIAIDPEGTLRAPVPLNQGLTYTAISQVPYRDRTQLRAAGAVYPADIEAAYLQIPPAIQARVREQTETLLAQAPNPVTDPYEKALFLAQALKQTYALQDNLPFFGPEDDLVEAFLFEYEGGYPDHFSTVLTIMLRSMGIPARLVAGFTPGQFNPFTGYYVVKNSDAYALTEVYFPDYGWFAFDPIPGHEIIPPSIREGEQFTVLRQFWNWVAGWLPSPVSGWLGRLFSAAIRSLSALLNFFGQGVIGIFGALLSTIALGFCGWLSWRGWRRWRRHVFWQQFPAVERAYQQMLAWLAAEGYPKHPAQTPLEYAAALHHRPQFAQSDQVMAIVQAYVRWRYGDRDTDAGQLARHVQALKKKRRANATTA